jgi:hypothetical protein
MLWYGTGYFIILVIVLVANPIICSSIMSLILSQIVHSVLIILITNESKLLICQLMVGMLMCVFLE